MILTGSFSGRRHRVSGKLPSDPAKQFARGLSRHAFAPIDASSDKTRVLGWVNARQILDTDLTWDKIAYGDHVVLGLRIDTRRVSRPILKARVAQVIGDRLREDPKARISRDERSRVAQALESEMLAQTPPATAIQELAWNTRTGIVWFSSGALKLNEEMQGLFEETFGLSLAPLGPFTLAERHTEATGKGAAALDRAEPTDLRP
jgi:recombination associated protein RdgC